MKKLILLSICLYAFMQASGQKQPVQPRTDNTVSEETGGWEKIISTGGNFKALMPGKAARSSTPVSTAVGDIDMHMYVLDKGDIAYFIAYSDYPEALISASDPQDLLEGAKEGALGKFTSKTVISEGNIKIDGYPGIKSHVTGTMLIDTDAMDVTFKGFQLLVNNRLYQVYLLNLGEFDETSANKFINSFILTN